MQSHNDATVTRKQVRFKRNAKKTAVACGTFVHALKTFSLILVVEVCVRLCLFVCVHVCTYLCVWQALLSHAISQKFIFNVIVSFQQSAPPFSLAVDVGCGTGISTRPLVEYFDHVIGCCKQQSLVQVSEASNGNTQCLGSPCCQSSLFWKSSLLDAHFPCVSCDVFLLLSYVFEISFSFCRCATNRRFVVLTVGAKSCASCVTAGTITVTNMAW